MFRPINFAIAFILSVIILASSLSFAEGTGKKVTPKSVEAFKRFVLPRGKKAMKIQPRELNKLPTPPQSWDEYEIEELRFALPSRVDTKRPGKRLLKFETEVISGFVSVPDKTLATQQQRVFSDMEAVWQAQLPADEEDFTKDLMSKLTLKGMNRGAKQCWIVRRDRLKFIILKKEAVNKPALLYNIDVYDSKGLPRGSGLLLMEHGQANDELAHDVAGSIQLEGDSQPSTESPRQNE